MRILKWIKSFVPVPDEYSVEWHNHASLGTQKALDHLFAKNFFRSLDNGSVTQMAHQDFYWRWDSPFIVELDIPSFRLAVEKGVFGKQSDRLPNSSSVYAFIYDENPSNIFRYIQSIHDPADQLLHILVFIFYYFVGPSMNFWLNLGFPQGSFWGGALRLAIQNGYPLDFVTLSTSERVNSFANFYTTKSDLGMPWVLSPEYLRLLSRQSNIKFYFDNNAPGIMGGGGVDTGTLEPDHIASAKTKGIIVLGGPQWTLISLIQVLAQEIGHVLGLGHTLADSTSPRSCGGGWWDPDYCEYGWPFRNERSAMENPYWIATDYFPFPRMIQAGIGDIKSIGALYDPSSKVRKNWTTDLCTDCGMAIHSDGISQVENVFHRH